jgi:Icc-related predicted phosphoesterase
MKFVAISDTHGKHQKLILPKGDVIIHAGDVSSKGQENEIVDFLKWFSALDFEYKIFIAGNHDFYFERQKNTIIQQLIPSNIIYLNDSSTKIQGISIWGSPISPWFYNWAFNRHRGEAIKKHWDKIPPNTDILITHGPAFGILDKTTRQDSVGCQDLLNKIKEIQPKFHICGHIHEAYGHEKQNNTEYFNASILDENYNLKNKPIVFDI